MLSSKFLTLFLASLTATSFALPIRREVPQEHSHEPIITSVRTSLNLNNPDNIKDPIFSLLGDAAAAQGAGDITDLSCLQQAVADQAFTNAKAANDVDGMTNALLFRALERNTGKVGLASALCTQTAKNPEIAAISQHQDPASSGAAATNKAIALEVAKQIHSIGGDPTDAIKSGTFAPGDVNDPTAKGNTCDDANDPNGCIFTLNLLVPDVTVDEINAAIGGGDDASATATDSAVDAASTVVDSTATAADATVTAADAASTCPPPVTATVTVTAAAATATADDSVDVVATDAATVTDAAATAATTAAAAATTAAASGGNFQKFTGALGGISPPPVVSGGKGFVTDNSDFINLSAAIGRSCDVQHNQCANKANSGGGFAVGDCDKQDTACRAQ